MTGNGTVWLKSNVGTLILLVTLGISLVVQWTLYGEAAKLSERTAQELARHSSDTQRHLDPVRDERRWQELLERLKAIESTLQQERR